MSGSAVEVYHTDRLGSVRALTNASGAVVASFRSDESGLSTATSGSSSQPFGFTGEPRDATGLTYLRARYYDPALGRFVSRDEWPQALRSSITLNRFVYANQNPVTYRDPSGRDTNGVCITAEGAFTFLFGEAAICIVVSDAGQGGVVLMGGGGGGAGVGGTAGVSFIHADAAEIYDLEGPFVTVGGSGALGVGLQGEAFLGAGHCGQIVSGATGGVVVGATGSAQVGATETVVLFGLGSPRSICSGK